MVKNRRWLHVAVLALLSAVGFYAWPGKQQAPDVEPEQTVSVTLRKLQETVTATGVIRPVVGAEVNVGSRISGTVISLPVVVGDRVQAGQLLAELDSTVLQATVDQMQADVALVRPRIALAESILERRRRLAQNDLASDEDLDTAIRDLAVERAQLDASLARLNAAEISLDYARITAPINGVIGQVTTRKGETVAADFSAPTFVTIVDLERLEVLTYVDETDIGRVAVGQSAMFTVDTYPDQEFYATVKAIQPKAELRDSVVNYIVRLEFELPEDYILRPEMTAHVRLVVAERDGVLTAPRMALKRADGRQYVMVERAGEWVEQDVSTGWRSENSIEILNGLRAGDVVGY